MGGRSSIILQGYPSCLLNQGLSQAWNSLNWTVSPGESFSTFPMLWLQCTHSYSAGLVCSCFSCIGSTYRTQVLVLSDRRFPGRLHCPPVLSLSSLNLQLVISEEGCTSFCEVKSEVSLQRNQWALNSCLYRCLLKGQTKGYEATICCLKISRNLY